MNKINLTKIKDSKIVVYALAAFAGIIASNKYLTDREKNRRDELMWDDYKERHPEEIKNEEE